MKRVYGPEGFKRPREASFQGSRPACVQDRQCRDNPWRPEPRDRGQKTLLQLLQASQVFPYAKILVQASLHFAPAYHNWMPTRPCQVAGRIIRKRLANVFFRCAHPSLSLAAVCLSLHTHSVMYLSSSNKTGLCQRALHTDRTSVPPENHLKVAHVGAK